MYHFSSESFAYGHATEKSLERDKVYKQDNWQ